MSGFYLNILSSQRPFPFNTDESDRHMLSCNYLAMARGPIDTWEEDLATIISNAGLGTLNTDMWIGDRPTVPSGAGPYITILDTGGLPEQVTHNGDIYEMLSAQIVVRGQSLVVARTRALAIWRALSSQFNLTVA